MFYDQQQSNRDVLDMPPAHWNDNYGEIMIYAVLLLNKQLERTDDEYADFRCRGAQSAKRWFKQLNGGATASGRIAYNIMTGAMFPNGVPRQITAIQCSEYLDQMCSDHKHKNFQNRNCSPSDKDQQEAYKWFKDKSFTKQESDKICDIAMRSRTTIFNNRNGLLF